MSCKDMQSITLRISCKHLEFIQKYTFKLFSCNMELIENDFERFFNSLKQQNFSTTEITTICKPIADYYRKESCKKWLLLLICLAIPYALFVWCDSFNWFLSAIGRLLLIQLLPYWNWADLYNAKCLIDRPKDSNNNKPLGAKLTNYETESGNCLLCDNIDFIPTVSNITFSTLETLYLESGLPVVITDSHKPQQPLDYFHTIFDNSLDFLESSPCDISTNLILKKFFDIEIVLRKAYKLLESYDKWFLQLRNCQFKAVKSARNFIRRPYYYPLHLEPYYSSWLLMSHNYNHQEYQEILLQGLIIIQQLAGALELRLMPKIPCDVKCPVMNIQLNAGEGFIFSTDLWLLNYKFIKTNQASISTVMEIDWSV